MLSHVTSESENDARVLMLDFVKLTEKDGDNYLSASIQPCKMSKMFKRILKMKIMNRFI